jgi:hypothetical protein
MFTDIPSKYSEEAPLEQPMIPRHGSPQPGPDSLSPTLKKHNISQHACKRATPKMQSSALINSTVQPQHIWLATVTLNFPADQVVI